MILLFLRLFSYTLIHFIMADLRLKSNIESLSNELREENRCTFDRYLLYLQIMHIALQP